MPPRRNVGDLEGHGVGLDGGRAVGGGDEGCGVGVGGVSDGGSVGYGIAVDVDIGVDEIG